MTDQSAVLMTQQTFGFFDAIGLVASVMSLVLAVVAIGLSLWFKRESDELNRVTRDLLKEVQSESKAISQLVMPELKAYGESMRGAMINNNVIQLGAATPHAAVTREQRNEVSAAESGS
ncbi:MAG: hypothetical protein JJU27_12200 [Gammaproteobacteria bacterium]|nr:hypothetical protein [Gammaproteobacteria bacterium]